MEILTNSQVYFLDKVKSSDFLIKNFYLTGGTALAAFYLKHRYSEDLDFFSEKEVDLLSLNIFFESFKKNSRIIKIDFEQSFNRNLFFVHFQDAVLKTEFTFFPFPRIEKSNLDPGFDLDSLLDIAVNKLFTIYQRTQARDYIDLYYICKGGGFLIEDLLKKARAKFDWHIDPLQLGTQFSKVTEAKDYPRMILEIEPEEWQRFFINGAKKLKNQIFV